MARIIYQNEQGGCSVVVPAPGFRAEDVAAKDVPADRPFTIVPDEAIPRDRTYRNAWEPDHVAGRVVHNMSKCREIHRDYLRQARAPLLAALDVAYLRADETPGPTGQAEKARIMEEKQALRNVTADPAINAAQTPDELKAVWPPILGANPLMAAAPVAPEATPEKATPTGHSPVGYSPLGYPPETPSNIELSSLPGPSGSPDVPGQPGS